MHDLITYLNSQGIDAHYLNTSPTRYKTASLMDFPTQSEALFQKAASVLPEEHKEQLETIALLQALNFKTASMIKLANETPAQQPVTPEPTVPQQQPVTEPHIQEPHMANTKGVKPRFFESAHFKKWAPVYAGAAIAAPVITGLTGYMMGHAAGKRASIEPPFRKSAAIGMPKKTFTKGVNLDSLKDIAKHRGSSEGATLARMMGQYALKPATLIGAGVGAAGLIGAAHLWNTYADEEGGE